MPLAVVLAIGMTTMPRAIAQTGNPPAMTDKETPPAAAPTSKDSAPAPTSKPASGAVPGDGIPALVVDGEHAQGILGKQVRSSTGEDMGRIVDVIVDRSARVRAAVIDFGGFLGVGNRQIAVAWNAIRFSTQGKADLLLLDLTRDQLRVAPAYKAGEQIVLLGTATNPPRNAPDTGGESEPKPALKDAPAK